MNEVTLTSESVEQTMAIAGAISKAVGLGSTIALNGMLGAGKTQFVRGLVNGLGMDSRMVSSPTFVLMQEYLNDSNDMAILHIDAYRINDVEELVEMGWDDVAKQESISVIEWAERIESQLPADTIFIDIEHTEDTVRTLNIRSNSDLIGKEMFNSVV